MTSQDGITWTSRSTSGVSGTRFNGITWSEELKCFVAVGGSGASDTMFSRNGADWTAVASASESLSWQEVAYGKGTGLFVAVSSGGVTNVIMTSPGPVRTITSWGGQTTLDNITLHDFVDLNKQRYRIEMVWDGDNDLGLRCEEVYFPTAEQKITESAEGLVLTCNGQIYGDITRIYAFTSGTSWLAYS